MPTKEQLELRIASDLVRKDRANITLPDIRDALLSSSPQERAKLVASVRRGATGHIGAVMDGIIVNYLKAKALVEAQSMLSEDSTLTLDELSRWLDD